MTHMFEGCYYSVEYNGILKIIQILPRDNNNANFRYVGVRGDGAKVTFGILSEVRQATPLEVIQHRTELAEATDGVIA